ncbi:hypothetical protein [Parvularcula oceani]|uniref:hypothetical protein n=1 Tax=Parvularcula oceani TaxID=1247963 RepID=UPI0004E18E9E|nr:hypothetical protein [Parvularcula oceani]
MITLLAFLLTSPVYNELPSTFGALAEPCSAWTEAVEAGDAKRHEFEQAVLGFLSAGVAMEGEPLSEFDYFVLERIHGRDVGEVVVDRALQRCRELSGQPVVYEAAFTAKAMLRDDLGWWRQLPQEERESYFPERLRGQ